MDTDHKVLPFKRTPEAIQALEQEFEERREGRFVFNDPPKERECETLVEWVREALTRRERGHTLFIANDFFAGTWKLGFVDDDENHVFYLHILKLKEAGDLKLAVGVDPEVLRTEEGRKTLLEGPNPDYSYSSHPPVERGLDSSLRDIWVAESLRPPASVPDLKIPRPFKGSSRSGSRG